MNGPDFNRVTDPMLLPLEEAKDPQQRLICRIKELEAEIKAMRPVVEAAIKLEPRLERTRHRTHPNSKQNLINNFADAVMAYTSGENNENT